MKNKFLLLLLISFIVMPSTGELTKIKDERAAVIKNKNAEGAKNKKNKATVIRKKTENKINRTAVKRKKSTKNIKRNARISAKNAKLNINARILFASKNIKKNKSAKSHLKSYEKELTGYLDYNDYKLLKSGSKKTKINATYKLKLARGGTVKITPVSSEDDRIKANVVWNVPGANAWSTTLNFKKGKRSIISGPKDKKGGMYLMSMEIK